MKFVCFLLVFIFIFSNIAYASDIDRYKNILNSYCDTFGYDFMGIYGDQLYFKLREDYSGHNIIKVISFDIKTLPEQFKIDKKVYNDNQFIYDGLFYLFLLRKMVDFGLLKKSPFKYIFKR